MTAARAEIEQPEREEIDRRIAQIRVQMDELDTSLVSLLNQRATCAREIGTLKGTVGLEVYQPEREIEGTETRTVQEPWAAWRGRDHASI